MSSLLQVKVEVGVNVFVAVFVAAAAAVAVAVAAAAAAAAAAVMAAKFEDVGAPGHFEFDEAGCAVRKQAEHKLLVCGVP